MQTGGPVRQIGLSYRPALESISGLLKRLRIRAPVSNIPELSAFVNRYETFKVSFSFECTLIHFFILFIFHIFSLDYIESSYRLNCLLYTLSQREREADNEARASSTSPRDVQTYSYKLL
jgi:hypothetical protein